MQKRLSAGFYQTSTINQFFNLVLLGETYVRFTVAAEGEAG
jgi:hypothetical protein